MIEQNVNSVILSDVIAASVYTLPVTYAVNEDISLNIRSIGTLVTGTGTLARNVTIRVDTAFTPKNGWSYVINWRATLAIVSYTVTIQSTDVTALVTGAQNIDFYVEYLNGAWEVKNIVTQVNGLLPDLTPYALKLSPAFTGNPTVPNQTAGDNSTKIANTAYVKTATDNLSLSQYAPKASPTLTGTVTIPNVSNPEANTQQAANTAFVQAALVQAIGFYKIYNLVAYAATIDVSSLATGVFNTIEIDSITGNLQIDGPEFAGNVSEITFLLPFAGTHTVTAGTNMDFADITGASTHTSVLTMVWSVEQGLYIQKSFSQN